MKTMVLLVLFAVSATLLLSFFGFRHFYGISSDLRGEVRRFQEAREVISGRYVGVVLDEGYLTDQAIAASVAALGDPWSRFLTEEQYQAHLRSQENRQQGIGLIFGRDEETNEVVVLDTTPGSPAEQAGLVTGDVIVMLDGQNIAEMENDEVRTRIHAHYGGRVEMEVRNEAGELRTVSVEVREFFVNPVSYELLEGTIGYIRIMNFDQGSGEAAIAAIEALYNDGAVSLLFDVRNNPGGRVNELLLLLDYLLPEGELFVFQDYAGNETIRHGGSDYLDMPMAVLINERSFSAAEFFAAILQEQDWATIVGVETTGKGRSQVTIPLSGGGAIVLSTSRYLTPGRVDLYEIGGIRPDVRVEAAEGSDRQLDRAVAVLRDMANS